MFFSDDFENNLLGEKIKGKAIEIEESDYGGYTISEKISSIFNVLYSDYIRHNKLLTAVILGIFLFLIYRYCKKLDKERFSKFSKSSKFKKLAAEIDSQTDKLKYNEQPTINPLKKLRNNKSYGKTNYIPEPVYMKAPNGKMIDGRKLYPYAKPYPELNKHAKDEHTYKNRRNYYTGTKDTYTGEQDPIPHPYDWPSDIVSSTGKFVSGMTNKNKSLIDGYYRQLSKNSDYLVSNDRDGPAHLNVGNPELNMDPPYATNI